MDEMNGDSRTGTIAGSILCCSDPYGGLNMSRGYTPDQVGVMNHVLDLLNCTMGHMNSF